MPYRLVHGTFPQGVFVENSVGSQAGFHLGRADSSVEVVSYREFFSAAAEHLRTSFPENDPRSILKAALRSIRVVDDERQVASDIGVAIQRRRYDVQGAEMIFAAWEKNAAPADLPFVFRSIRLSALDFCKASLYLLSHSSLGAEDARCLFVRQFHPQAPQLPQGKSWQIEASAGEQSKASWQERINSFLLSSRWAAMATVLVIAAFVLEQMAIVMVPLTAYLLLLAAIWPLRRSANCLPSEGVYQNGIALLMRIQACSKRKIARSEKGYLWAEGLHRVYALASRYGFEVKSVRQLRSDDEFFEYLVVIDGHAKLTIDREGLLLPMDCSLRRAERSLPSAPLAVYFSQFIVRSFHALAEAIARWENQARLEMVQFPLASYEIKYASSRIAGLGNLEDIWESHRMHVLDHIEVHSPAIDWALEHRQAFYAQTSPEHMVRLEDASSLEGQKIALASNFAASCRGQAAFAEESGEMSAAGTNAPGERRLAV